MGPRTYRGLRASADRVNVRSLLHHCQLATLVATKTEHIQTYIAYSFYNSLWHHHPDCYASCRLIFLPCVCFASIYASTAAKSYILNYMWTAANFIIEGRVRPEVVHRWSQPGVSKLFCPRATQSNTEHVEGRTSYAV